MANLKAAHRELFRRAEDERFETVEDLIRHCRDQREAASELWHPPGLLMPQVGNDSLQLQMGSDGAFALNHWSFSQLCGLCGVSRDTINSLSPETATRALQETKPAGSKPLQILLGHERVRAIHGTRYSRLWNADLLEAVQEAAPDFQPPQRAVTGGTGLYCGEQDRGRSEARSRLERGQADPRCGRLCGRCVSRRTNELDGRANPGGSRGLPASPEEELGRFILRCGRAKGPLLHGRG